MDREGTASARHERVQHAVRDELATIVRDDLEDPELDGVVVTAVVLAADHKSARVHFAVPRDRPRTAVERAFGRATPYIRSLLSTGLDLRRVPDLRFVYEGELPRSASDER